MTLFAHSIGLINGDQLLSEAESSALIDTLPKSPDASGSVALSARGHYVDRRNGR